MVTLTRPTSYFAAYELSKKALTPAGADPSTLNLTAVILAGGTAGVAMWSLAIPPDVRAPLISYLDRFLDNNNDRAMDIDR